jgi:hypothetical protein
MAGGFDSLDVATASGVALYALVPWKRSGVNIRVAACD